MARLALSMLGPLEIMLDGTPLSGFESNKVRALLVYLVIEADRPHHRQVLAGLLWPNHPDRTARTYLRNALSNLRHIIGDHKATLPFLMVTPQTIQFNRASDHRLDVASYEKILGMAQEASPVRRQLEEAAALYRGGFLQDLSLKDSPGFEDWALLVRERLQRQALTTLHRLAEYHEQSADYKRACDYAWRRVELAPWQEEAHQQLMRLLALSGQRSAALAQYERCRHLLREELDVPPAAETTQLYERIRDGGFDGQTGQGLESYSLPTPLTPLVGRETELAEIADRLQDPACRLLTLTGPGGSGKSHLALAAAIDLLSREQTGLFGHGIFWVSLAPLQSVEAIVPTIAQALGFSFYGPDNPQQQLLNYMRQKSMLLVLDNFEHLLASSDPPAQEKTKKGIELVVELLKTAPAVKIVVTSRVSLNMQGETLFPVTGMAYPVVENGRTQLQDADRIQTRPEQEQGVQDISQYGAVKLFLQGVRRAGSSFNPTAEELWSIVHICHLVQGMPLAILLAAAWGQMLSPADIVARISEQQLDFFEMDWPDVPERQRSMRAVFSHSWRLLTEREQLLFQELSIFRGGFSWQSAQHVSGASLRELLGLINKSLLQRAPEGRYEIHELLRQYAAEQLEQNPTRTEAARDRHTAYFAAFLQQREVDLRGARQQTALVEIKADLENARAAWNWAVEQDHVTYIAQTIDGLCRFYEWQGRNEEGASACRLAATRLIATNGLVDVENLAEEAAQHSNNDLRVLVKVWTWQSVFSRTLGQIALADQLLEQSLSLLTKSELDNHDTQLERAAVLREMGHVKHHLGKRTEAQRLYTRSLDLFKALGIQPEVADLLIALSGITSDFGRYDETKQLLQESLAIRQARGDRLGIADAVRRLGDLAGKVGRLEEAERLARESLTISQEIGNRLGATDSLFQLASELTYLGQFSQAQPLLEECTATYNELGRRSDFANATDILSWVKINLGLYEQALDHARNALNVFKEIGQRRGNAIMLLNFGELKLAEEAYLEAQQFVAESVSIFREIEDQEELGLALAELAHAEIGLGHTTPAQQYLSEALRISDETKAHAPALFSIAKVALLLTKREEPERAVELYALVARYPYVGNSRYWEDIIGGHIASAAAALSQEVVALAKQRGQLRDLTQTVAELLDELKTTAETRKAD